MSNKNYLEDIAEIKNLMNRSSRFISLSGLSGVFAGSYALIGALIAYLFFPINKYQQRDIYSEELYMVDIKIIITLIVVAALSIITAFFLTTKRAKQNGEKIWDETTKRLLINFSIPLVVGGIYILINMSHQHYGQTAALMLIFYGLALVNASKFTIGNVKYLGYIEILLGIICAIIPGFGFWFWVIGFGVCHIIYGLLMYKQERK